jgi:hypothetical protein
VRIETVAAPAERRPERAIGERPRFARILHTMPKLGARTAGIDDQVERPCPSPVGADQHCALAGFQCLKLGAYLDGDRLAPDGAEKHAEQGRPVHRQPETTAALRIVADVEHGAAGFRIGAMQTVDAAAQRQDVVEQTEIGKHRQPGRLQDQPGPDRLWLVEALEDGDPMPCALQIECRGQSGRAGAGNRDVQRNAHCPPNPAQAGQSFSGIAKSSRRSWHCHSWHPWVRPR